MASTEEMSAARTTRRSTGNGGKAKHSEDELFEQVDRLQKDLKEIAATVAKLADQKMDEARGTARHEVRNLIRTGQHAVDEIQDEFGHMEKQIKDTIRQKPLTAVIGAIAVGFVLALVTR